MAAGVASQDGSQVGKDQTNMERKQSPEICTTESSTMVLMDSQGINNEVFKNSLVQSMAGATDGGGHITSIEHLQHLNNLVQSSKDAVPSWPIQGPNCASHVVEQVSSLASILSRVMPKQIESIEAEQFTDIRAQWEDIFDALEEERLKLPKIKTNRSRKSGVTTRTNSPRDSGGVKRIAEQLKSSSILRATNLDKAPCADKDKAFEDATLAKGRPYWSKIHQQKQAIVF